MLLGHHMLVTNVVSLSYNLQTCHFMDLPGEAANRMRLCTWQFGTDMTLTRQAAPGAPREVVARIPLSKWPTPSWIHDFPVTCVAARPVQPCLSHAELLTDHE